MHGARAFLTTLGLLSVFATPARTKDWDETTSPEEKSQFAAAYAHKRCGDKIVGGGSDSVPSFVTKSMIMSYINVQCPLRKPASR